MSARDCAPATCAVNRIRIKGLMGRIIFKCRACNDEIMYVPAQAGASRCPQCGKEMPVRPDESLLNLGVVQNCVSCGHDAFYVQKDFNRGLGLVVVAAGVFASLFFFSRTEPFYAMLCLMATAALDLLIYSFV